MINGMWQAVHKLNKSVWLLNRRHRPQPLRGFHKRLLRSKNPIYNPSQLQILTLTTPVPKNSHNPLLPLHRPPNPPKNLRYLHSNYKPNPKPKGRTGLLGNLWQMGGLKLMGGLWVGRLLYSLKGKGRLFCKRRSKGIQFGKENGLEIRKVDQLFLLIKRRSRIKKVCWNSFFPKLERILCLANRSWTSVSLLIFSAPRAICSVFFTLSHTLLSLSNLYAKVHLSKG